MGADTGAPEFQCRIQLLLMDPSFQVNMSTTLLCVVCVCICCYFTLKQLYTVLQSWECF